MNPENEIDKTEALEPVETAAANVAEARGGVDGRKRPKWLLPLIAVVCAVVLVVTGVVGWNMYRGAKLAEAKEACATAADGVRSQANEYNALLNGDAADAAAVKAEQVKDAKTVESLGKELKASAPEYEGCVAEDAKGLDAATVKLGMGYDKSDIRFVIHFDIRRAYPAHQPHLILMRISRLFSKILPKVTFLSEKASFSLTIFLKQVD